MPGASWLQDTTGSSDSETLGPWGFCDPDSLTSAYVYDANVKITLVKELLPCFSSFGDISVSSDLKKSRGGLICIDDVVVAAGIEEEHCLSLCAFLHAVSSHLGLREVCKIESGELAPSVFYSSESTDFSIFEFHMSLEVVEVVLPVNDVGLRRVSFAQTGCDLNGLNWLALVIHVENVQFKGSHKVWSSFVLTLLDSVSHEGDPNSSFVNDCFVTDDL
jgi:hypothetical protein